LPKGEPKRRWDEHDFVRNAAHDLRAPVAAISSAVEVLQAGAKDDPEARDRFLGHVEVATERLERLIDALLILARAQSGEQEPLVSAVPLEPLLHDVLEDLAHQIGVSLEALSPPGLTVATNPQLLEQLLANLVANAAKHTDTGSIRLVASQVDDSVAIEVQDTGHGLDSSDQALAERKLSRRDSPDLLGVGLTIVREAVGALGGEVEIGPRSGGGTIARVVLPAGEATSQ
jgi:signal transduction histidine kinase